MNPVYIYLEDFHLRLIELVQAASIVRKSYVDQSASDLKIGIRSGAALVIRDISGPVETSGSDFIIGDITIPKGTSWAAKYFVASKSTIMQDDYDRRYKAILSDYYQYLYVQGYEALISFWIDILIHPSVSSLSVRRIQGSELLKKIERECKHDQNNIRIKEVWSILKDCRNSITHSKSLLDLPKMFKSKHYEAIFNELFNLIEVDNVNQISLDFRLFHRLIQTIAEYNYQIFKFISKNKNWEYDLDVLKG